MQLPAGPPYALFGDPAYPLSPYLQKAYAGAALTQQQTIFHTDMAAVRQSVEWSFGDITVMWAFVDFKKNLKIDLQSLALYYMVADLLTNCHTILRGQQNVQVLRCSSTRIARVLSVIKFCKSDTAARSLPVHTCIWPAFLTAHYVRLYNLFILISSLLILQCSAPVLHILSIFCP